jgi:antitoxin component HigA of HigAB toxin-antitoxin module
VEEDGAFMVEEYKDPIDVIQTQIDQSHLSQSYLASQT